MNRWNVLAACAVLSVSCSPTESTNPPPTDVPQMTDTPKVTLRVLSSLPQYVSGGDARIAIEADKSLQPGLELWLNGQKVSLSRQTVTDGGVEGILGGLQLGENYLEVRSVASGRLAWVALKNHPITGPMFSGPQQEPFVCSVRTDLGKEPLPDTTDAKYYAVHDGSGKTVGYSKNCSMDSYVTYYYMPVGKLSHRDYKPLPTDGTRPSDIAKTKLVDGREVDFIVRWERGTINRFIYQYVMLAPFGEDPTKPDLSLWNKRLIYHFQGGVGFGHYQGGPDTRAGLAYAIGKGYAIVHSSGNRTGEHYNLVLGGETALMTKEGFVKRYGVPLYTVGLGASGGGIQQYIYPQNHPGQIIDAAVAQQPYPDMVGQIPHIGDCELLEYYMDVTDRANAKWSSDVKNRSLLVGLNAEESVANPFWALQPALPNVKMAKGSTECRKAWMGLTAGAMNPVYDADDIVPKAAARMNLLAFGPVHFTHFEDLKNIYGVGADGYARSTWDNVGVQYGLESLLRGQISPAEFLDVNFKVGGWKQSSEMVPEGFPYNGTGASEVAKVLADASYFDPWGSRSMNRWNPLTPTVPAPRTHGDVEAMAAMYDAGLTFSGQTTIPTIDWHPYLEKRLDMHNVHQSFAIRKRIAAKLGSADHQAIWFTDTTNVSSMDFDQVPMALDVIDEWMANIRKSPSASVAQNRPDRAVDSCFDTSGALIAKGPEVWSGVIDQKPAGACTQKFPMYSTSRRLAGGPYEGGVFKCALKSVDAALRDGTYGSWKPSLSEIQKLKAIFPEGVCDYKKPDQSKPIKSAS